MYNDYSIELHRLYSFEFYCNKAIDIKKLALFGFYNYDSLLNDTVKCFFCKVEIGLWKSNDNILTEHLRWSPYCELLNRYKNSNIPINENELNRLLPPPNKFEFRYKICPNAVCDSSSSVKSNSEIVKKVQFNETPKIHHLITYGFAYQESRKGNWEQVARDRIRFQNRIKLIGNEISPILNEQHRMKIYISDKEFC